ncbi:hypothetical protein P0D87_12565 [Paraburkholderia sp. RL17-368-BIF-A]|uniref:hypothetical protein n=1 Tax=Paraburkholderia sp. RL17-368-BIF-A TaxID=3031628 RepID=UPI0006BCD940|nr:hypothetical protein AC233_31780 [Burkholderia sp. HB1]
MNRSYILSSDRLGTQNLNQQCDGCKECMFAGSDAKDAQPGGFVLKNGSPVVGDWKKALYRRNGVIDASPALQRRNLNDFIRYVPVGILQKGTRLLHVTSDAGWISRKMVGSREQDDYSFFTLENYGMASAHRNDLVGAVKLQLAQDLHCFFAKSYAFRFWREQEQRFHNGKTQSVIAQGHTRVGGELAGVVKASWPEKYRPAAWASCSECEIAIHNAVVPLVLEVIGAARQSQQALQPSRQRIGDGERVGSPQPGQTHAYVPTGELPKVAAPAGHDGISAPYWMSPYFHSQSKVKQAVERMRRANVPLTDSDSLFR